MKRYFITGTDTNCGKTYVTVQLVKYLSDTCAIKPVATGFTASNKEESDTYTIHTACPLPINTITPWQYPLPVSPHIAAGKAHSELSLTDIAQYCLQFSHPFYNRLIIEGAGGLCVPLTHDKTWVDFLIHTQIPVILVVGMRLGCINHALLTQLALEKNTIPCVGWIANMLDPNLLALEEVLITLQQLLHFPLLAQIPFHGTLQWHEKTSL